MKLELSNVTLDIVENKKHQRRFSGLNILLESGMLSFVMGNTNLDDFFDILRGNIPENGVYIGSFLINNEPQNDFPSYFHIVQKNDYLPKYFSLSEYLDFLLAGNINKDVALTDMKYYLKGLDIKNNTSTAMFKLRRSERLKILILAALLSDKPIIIIKDIFDDQDSFFCFEMVSFLDEVAKTSQKIIIIGLKEANSMISKFFGNFIYLHEDKQIYCGKYSKFKNFFETNNLECPESMNFVEYLHSLSNNSTNLEEIKRINFHSYCNNMPSAQIDESTLKKGKFSIKLKVRWKIIAQLLKRQVSYILQSRIIRKFTVFVLLSILSLSLISLFNSFIFKSFIASDPLIKDLKDENQIYSWYGNLSSLYYSTFVLFPMTYILSLYVTKHYKEFYNEVGRGLYTSSEMIFAASIFHFFFYLSIILVPGIIPKLFDSKFGYSNFQYTVPFFIPSVVIAYMLRSIFRRRVSFILIFFSQLIFLLRFHYPSKNFAGILFDSVLKFFFLFFSLIPTNSYVIYVFKDLVEFANKKIILEMFENEKNVIEELYFFKMGTMIMSEMTRLGINLRLFFIFSFFIFFWLILIVVINIVYKDVVIEKQKKEVIPKSEII